MFCFVFSLLKPQQRCCNFAYLCWGNRSLRFELGLVNARISFGHILCLSGQMARAVLEIKLWHSHCQTAHLELQGLKPCLVEIRRKMVVMKLLGYMISQHNFPVRKQNKKLSKSSIKINLNIWAHNNPRNKINWLRNSWIKVLVG